MKSVELQLEGVGKDLGGEGGKPWSECTVLKIYIFNK